MRALTLLVATAATLLLPMPVAAASAPAATPAVPAVTAPAAAPAATDPYLCWFPPRPGSGWTMTNHRFWSCEQCEAAGAAGVLNGDWPAYRCGWVPIGLDIEYFLFLPDA